MAIMAGSRIALRGKTATVNVIDGSGATIYSGITAVYEQATVTEGGGAFAELASRVVDVFFFEPISGTLPTIVEKHIIVWNSTRYRVEHAVNQAGQDNRLRVQTTRSR